MTGDDESHDGSSYKHHLERGARRIVNAVSIQAVPTFPLAPPPFAPTVTAPPSLSSTYTATKKVHDPSSSSLVHTTTAPHRAPTTSTVRKRQDSLSSSFPLGSSSSQTSHKRMRRLSIDVSLAAQDFPRNKITILHDDDAEEARGSSSTQMLPPSMVPVRRVASVASSRFASDISNVVRATSSSSRGTHSPERPSKAMTSLESDQTNLGDRGASFFATIPHKKIQGKPNNISREPIYRAENPSLTSVAHDEVARLDGRWEPVFTVTQLASKALHASSSIVPSSIEPNDLHELSVRQVIDQPTRGVTGCSATVAAVPSIDSSSDSGRTSDKSDAIGVQTSSTNDTSIISIISSTSDESTWGSRATRRSARESSLRIRSYFDGTDDTSGDESNNDQNGPKRKVRSRPSLSRLGSSSSNAPLGQALPAAPLASLSSAGTTSTAAQIDDDDEDELAPAIKRCISFEDDAGKTAGIDQALRDFVQSLEAASTEDVKNKIDFAKEWLRLAYEPHKGFNVSRTGLFSTYTAACERYGVKILNTATFGKVIGQVHPTVRTRRLGGRQNSRYHYIDFRPTTNEELRRLLAADAPEQIRVHVHRRKAPNLNVGSLRPQSLLPFTMQDNQSVSPYLDGSVQDRGSESGQGDQLEDDSADDADISNNVEPESCDMGMARSFLPPFQAVFDANLNIDLGQATDFWKRIDAHFVRLQKAINSDDYDNLMTELSQWWSALDASDRDLAVLPDPSRAIYAAFRDICSTLDGRLYSSLFSSPAESKLDELELFASQLKSTQHVALGGFNGTFFSRNLIELYSTFSHRVELLRGCRNWIAALQPVFDSPEVVKGLQAAWMLLDLDAIERSRAVGLVDAGALNTCLQWIRTHRDILELISDEDRGNAKLESFCDQLHKGFGFAVAAQPDPQAVQATWSSVGEQNLKHLVEDLFNYHILRIDTLPPVPLARPSAPVSAERPRSRRIMHSDPKGTEGVGEASESAVTSASSYGAHPPSLASISLQASPVSAWQERPGPPALHLIRNSPGGTINPVSSSPMSMPPRHAPIMVQAAQRANLNQEFLAVSSPPPFVLSPRLYASFLERQRVSPILSRSPVIGAYNWSSERCGDDEERVTGQGSSSATATAGELSEIEQVVAVRTKDSDRVPDTATYYPSSSQWR